MIQVFHSCWRQLLPLYLRIVSAQQMYKTLLAVAAALLNYSGDRFTMQTLLSRAALLL